MRSPFTRCEVAGGPLAVLADQGGESEKARPGSDLKGPGPATRRPPRRPVNGQDVLFGTLVRMLRSYLDTNVDGAIAEQLVLRRFGRPLQ